MLNSIQFSFSACLVAPETEGAALAPVSAVGRASAVCWAPQKRLTVWRRTTCSPPARQEGDPVDLREDDALRQDSAAMQVSSIQILSEYSHRRYIIPLDNNYCIALLRQF